MQLTKIHPIIYPGAAVLSSPWNGLSVIFLKLQLIIERIKYGTK